MNAQSLRASIEKLDLQNDAFLSEWVDVTNDWWQQQIDATTSQKSRIMRVGKRKRKRNQREKKD